MSRLRNSNFNSVSHLRRLPVFQTRRNSLILYSTKLHAGTKLAHGSIKGFDVAKGVHEKVPEIFSSLNLIARCALFSDFAYAADFNRFFGAEVSGDLFDGSRAV